MPTLTRPTTVAQRSEFSALTDADKAILRGLATNAYDGTETVSACWKAAFTAFASAKACRPATGGGMPKGHTFDRVVGHRLVTLRATSGSCSCGQSYSGADKADVRGAHAAHKAQDVS